MNALVQVDGVIPRHNISGSVALFLCAVLWPSNIKSWNTFCMSREVTLGWKQSRERDQQLDSYIFKMAHVLKDLLSGGGCNLVNQVSDWWSKKCFHIRLSIFRGQSSSNTSPYRHERHLEKGTLCYSKFIMSTWDSALPGLHCTWCVQQSWQEKVVRVGEITCEASPKKYYPVMRCRASIARKMLLWFSFCCLSNMW